MNKHLIIVPLLVLLFSCKEKLKNEQVEEYVYFYTKDKNLKPLTDKHPSYKAVVSGDSIYFFEPDTILIHQEKFGRTKDGIYLLRDKDSLLLYSFKIREKVHRDTSLQYFFYENAILIEKKEYYLDEKNYTLYHFIESGWDETLDSYYMEDEGFICFYKYANDYFLYLDSPNATKVSPAFLTDTSFFALLQMREKDKKIGRIFDEDK